MNLMFTLFCLHGFFFWSSPLWLCIAIKNMAIHYKTIQKLQRRYFLASDDVNTQEEHETTGDKNSSKQLYQLAIHLSLMPLSGDVIHVCLFVYFSTDERVIVEEN